MEAADRPARDRDEGEGEEVAGEDGSRAVDEAGEGRHAEWRQRDEDAGGEHDDHADLDEGRQVVARGEQQPHRQDGGREPVPHEQQRQRAAGEREGGRERRLGGHPAAGEEGEREEDEADRAGLQHASRPEPAHVDAHEHRDGDREPDGDRAPRARLEGVHDDESEDGDEHDHDAEHGDHRGEAGDGADLLARHFAQRLAIAADGGAEDDEVLHRAAEHDADDDPQDAGEVAELRGEGRADERAGSGDGGEVMAEDDPSVGRDEVASVGEAMCGRRAGVVEREDGGADEGAVEAIRDGVGTEGGDEEPRGAHRLAARQGDHAQGRCTQHGDSGPDDRSNDGPGEHGRWHGGQVAPRRPAGQSGLESPRGRSRRGSATVRFRAHQRVRPCAESSSCSARPRSC